MRKFGCLMKRPLIQWISAFLVAALVALWVLARSDFRHIFNYINAFTTGGSVCVLISLMSWTILEGALDIFTYAFKSPLKRKQTDYRSYCEEKRQARNKFRFLPFLIVGVWFIVVGLVLKFFL